MAEKKNAAAVRTKKDVEPTRQAVTIDFPQEGEKVMPGHYAVRLTADGPGPVEISVNDGAWSPCRSEVGHFWFDWWPSEPGRHKLTARVNGENGRGQKSKTRTCTVVGPSSS